MSCSKALRRPLRTSIARSAWLARTSSYRRRTSSAIVGAGTIRRVARTMMPPEAAEHRPKQPPTTRRRAGEEVALAGDHLKLADVLNDRAMAHRPAVEA